MPRPSRKCLHGNQTSRCHPTMTANKSGPKMMPKKRTPSLHKVVMRPAYGDRFSGTVLGSCFSQSAIIEFDFFGFHTLACSVSSGNRSPSLKAPRSTRDLLAHRRIHWLICLRFHRGHCSGRRAPMFSLLPMAFFCFKTSSFTGATPLSLF